MNKQELIKHIEDLPYNEGFIVDTIKISRKGLLELVSQLDEPEKVQVPQFVADWIEVCKEHLTTSLYTAMSPNFMKENNQSFDFILWIKKTSNQETFARAWLDGYIVEEEKHYKIEIKGVSENSVLIHDKTEECWFFEDGNNEDTIYVYHTRKELEEAGFGWVFNCEGIEIEEVEG